MSWVTILWSTSASACLTLAEVCLLVWCRRPTARADLFFALTGLGLGLTICRSIAIAQQGRWWAESNEMADSSPTLPHSGKGSTIELELPTAELPIAEGKP